MTHPRNRHQGRYHFQALMKSHPALKLFVAENKYGDESIDFSNPEAVKTLNRALLHDLYGISAWDIPPQYLCPPIPGRADYIHSIADVLADSNDGEIPRGKAVRALDVGVGANCIYPMLGHLEYGWSFLGSDINPVALDSAKWIIDSNPLLQGAIELRLQPTKNKILDGLLHQDERFDFSMCNPPFHGSLEEAQAGTKRKWKNLGKEGLNKGKQLVNFGGQGAELWCEGGEIAFTQRMIEESAKIPLQVFWFSTLVSKEGVLPKIYSLLKKNGATLWKTIDMAQGQKKSRIVAWTFLDPEAQVNWKKTHWRQSK